MERLFSKWAEKQNHINSSKIVGKKEANIFVNENIANHAKRCPDFAFFSGLRLDEERDVHAIAAIRKYLNFKVIFWFSWVNKMSTEKDSVDDMMMYARVGDYE